MYCPTLAQSSGRASQLLTAAYSHGVKRLAELSHAMRTTDTGVDSGYQLLMLDRTSTGVDDPVVCGPLSLRTALQ